MLKKVSVIFTSFIFLVTVANLFAEEDKDQNIAPPRHARIQRRLLQQQRPGALMPQPGQRAGRITERPLDVQIEVIEKRIKAEPRTSVRPQAPAGLTQARQMHNRWFNALKKAYRENDREKMGTLIRKMEQLRKQAPQLQGKGLAQLRQRLGQRGIQRLQGRRGIQRPQAQRGIQRRLGQRGIQRPQEQRGLQGRLGRRGIQRLQEQRGVQRRLGRRGIQRPQEQRGVQRRLGRRGIQRPQAQRGIQRRLGQRIRARLSQGQRAERRVQRPVQPRPQRVKPRPQSDFDWDW